MGSGHRGFRKEDFESSCPNSHPLALSNCSPNCHSQCSRLREGWRDWNQDTLGCLRPDVHLHSSILLPGIPCPSSKTSLPRHHRTHHHLRLNLLLRHGHGDGNSFAHIVVKEAHKHTPDTVEHIFRQVFWARYVDWALTTPLLLLDLAFLAGMNGANITVTIVADLIMVLLGLFAAFGRPDGQKWGYYTIACIASLVIVYQLVVPGRRAVAAKSNSTAKLFASIGGFTLILWTLYPVVWGIGDGARKWSVDAEIIAYAVLDVLAKPVFGFWLLFA